MFIFVDESGLFQRNEKSRHAISCVAALIIPGRFLPEIERRFKKISKDWPKDKNGEAKGSLLAEEHLFDLCVMLEKYHAILNVCSFDMNVSSNDEVDAHKRGQANGLIANLTDEHHPNAVKSVYRDKARLDKMSRQLYAQSVAMTDAMCGAFELGMLYYCQRFPGELAKFIWRIDAKSPNKITNYEDWWHLNVKAFIQSKSMRKPTAALKSGDYSAFRRNFPKKETPEYLKALIPAEKHKDALDLNSILKDIKFEDSRDVIGLQIVDILANGFRRALSGRMQRSGWIGIGKLLIHSKRGAVVLNTFGDGQTIKTDYSNVVIELNKLGRSMLTNPRF